MAASRGVLGWVVCLGLLVIAAVPGRAAPTEARVTYVTASSFYVDAGRESGMAAGDSLLVIRKGATVAIGVASAVSSRSSVCVLARIDTRVLVGDLVRALHPASGMNRVAPVTPFAGRADQDRPNTRARPGPAVPPNRAPRSRIRAALRFFMSRGAPDAGALFQPGLELRASELATPLRSVTMTADLRTRQSFTRSADGDVQREPRSRLPRLSLTWRSTDGQLLCALGRGTPSGLAAGALDGITFEQTGTRWSGGAFSGSEPDSKTQRPSSAVQHHGAWFERHGEPHSGRSWALGGGAAGSYRGSEIEREFLNFNGRLQPSHASLRTTQEIDVRRDRASGADRALEITRSSFGAQTSLGSKATLDLSFERRLPRALVTGDSLNDETPNDAAWHLRASALLRPASELRIRLTAGTNDGARSTFGVGADTRLWRPFAVDLKSKLSRTISPRGGGWLGTTSLHGGVSRAALGVSAGFDVPPPLPGALRGADAVQRTRYWTGLDIDVTSGRHVYLLLNAQQTVSAPDPLFEMFFSIGYRH